MEEFLNKVKRINSITYNLTETEKSLVSFKVGIWAAITALLSIAAPVWFVALLLFANLGLVYYSYKKFGE